jgi:LPXTG-site transpeptidase (sortase) family protein
MNISSYKQRYNKLRPALFWILLLAAFIVTGFLLYREITSPLLAPVEITGIATEAPTLSPLPVGEAKPASHVPPQHPKQLRIPTLDVDANIHPVNTDHEGIIGAPANAWDVGWYSKSSMPGQKGTLLLDGHVNDLLNSPGVFAQLHTLQRDDDISIERGDGTTFRYHVVSTERIPLAQLSMKEILQTSDNKERLVIITCGGAYDVKAGTYSDRVVVFAERTS